MTLVAPCPSSRNGRGKPLCGGEQVQLKLLAEKKPGVCPLKEMNKHRIIEIIIATMIGAGVTIISKVVEAYVMNHITSVSNVFGGVAGAIAYLTEKHKYL